MTTCEQLIEFILFALNKWFQLSLDSIIKLVQIVNTDSLSYKLLPNDIRQIDTNNRIGSDADTVKQTKGLEQCQIGL